MKRTVHPGLLLAKLSSAVAIALLAFAGCEQSAPPATNTGGQADAPNELETVTFNEDIAPIFYQHCAACHRPGESAPFSLLTYDDAKQHAEQIVEVTSSRFMPPWLPKQGFGEFAHERRLSAQQIEQIRRWVEAGAPEGDSARRPEPPQWAEGWQLGEPDLIVTMPEEYLLQPEGVDVFRNFVLPVPISETRYVKAVEFRPSNPQVVHHLTMQIDPTPTSRRLDKKDEEPGYPGMLYSRNVRVPDGQLLGWTPGKSPYKGDNEMAWRIQPGTDLVLQLHMLPGGKPEPVQVSVGLYFAQKPPRRVPMVILIGSQVIDIAAGEKEYVIQDRYVLPVDVDVLGIYPHAHYLGKKMEVFATLPDGKRKWLLSIDDWDFNWQDEYPYAEPLLLPKGTALEMRYTYDNSAENVRNPSRPPRRVVYGERSTDEMGAAWIQVAPRKPTDLYILRRDYFRKDLAMRSAGYEHALQINPDDEEAFVSLGEAQAMRGEDDEAETHFRAALKIEPDLVPAHINLGLLLMRQEKLDEASEQLRRAIEIEPETATAYNNLGVIAERRGQLDEAIEQVQKALEIDRHLAEGHHNLGVFVSLQGDTERAIEHLQHALEINPDLAKTHVKLGALFFAQGNLDKAARHLSRGLRITPNDAEAQFYMGDVAQRQGRIEAAVKHLGRATEIDPDYAAAYFLLGVVQAKEKQPVEAAKQFQQVLRVSPENIEAIYLLGQMLQQQKKVPEAAAEYERLIALQPDHLGARHRLGYLRQQEGKPHQAVEQYRKLLELAPDNLPVANSLAWILATSDDPQLRNANEALGWARKCAEATDHKQVGILLTLAAACAEVGQFEEAQKWQAKAIQLAPATHKPELQTVLELYKANKPFREKESAKPEEASPAA